MMTGNRGTAGLVWWKPQGGVTCRALTTGAFLLLMAVQAACSCEADGPPPLGLAAEDEERPRPDAAAPCPESRDCPEVCCESGSVCGQDNACCAVDDLCGSTCCTDGNVCEGAICHLDCGEHSRCRDDSGGEVCCASDEVCTSGSCFRPETPCADFWDCDEGTYCERAMGFCLPQPTGEACQTSPSGGEVKPTLLWHWDGSDATHPEYNQVMMTPAIANLNDDNEDGSVDENDTPDVVFSSFCGIADAGCVPGDYNRDGMLRAVSGADGSSLFDVVAESQRVIAGAQVALGDLDGDGLVEIVACGATAAGEGPIVVFENDGAFKWRSADPSVKCGQSAPAIADINGDGFPEVIVRYSVLNGRDGSLVWHRECQNTGEFWASETLIRYEHLPCDYTAITDLDGDGTLELIGGNVAYNADGTERWNRTADFRDGYPAIGDLDRDGTPEIVVVHSAFTPGYARGDHHLRVLNSDGTDRWGPIDLNVPAVNTTAPYMSHLTTSRVAGGGPPTVANFDDDPEPEIALAGGYGYAVFEGDGTLKWFAATQDHSSRKTGSSVFDFDGDGVAEAVYNDEYWLRVYDGVDGTVRYCECNTSATHWEYPVIVDVNNDSHAEIVVSSNDFWLGECPRDTDVDACTSRRISAGETAGSHGVRVFAAPERDWVATRRIWNQHTYHITNVTESGQIPVGERRNWTLKGLNNFRQNAQPGANNIPDLHPIELALDLGQCADELVLHFRVENGGWAAAPESIPITIYVQEGDHFARVARLTTSRRLLPGESEALSLPYALAGRDPEQPVRFLVVINDVGDGPLPGLHECRDANNAAETTGNCTLVI